MHPNSHQFSDDPRDSHGGEWTPESLTEYQHWIEAEANKKTVNDTPNPYIKEALEKGKAPF